jgi:FixJ family two-component response regulator
MYSLAVHAPPNRVIAGAGSAECDASSPGEVVYLIEGDPQVRETLFTELTVGGLTVRSFRCAGEYFSSNRQDTAACLVFDVRLPDMSGFDLQGKLADESGPPAIFISAHPDVRSGVRAIKAGAVDFLIYPVRPDALLGAIREAFTRDRIARQRRSEIATLKDRYLRLTRRECEVFALVVRGFLNKQVAGILAISLVTVQIHRGHATRKMGARSFADLVCMAIKLQILEQESAQRLTYRVDAFG